MAHHAPQHAAGGHGHVAHHRVAQRFERNVGRHRLQAHGFAGAGAQVVEAVQLRQAEVRHVGRQAPHFLARLGQAVRMALQQVDDPGNRVGRRVFAGQQHGQHIAGDGAVVHATAGFVGGDDHGFEQVGRAHAPRGVLLQACARLPHQVGNGHVQRRHVAVQAPVDGQLDVAPVGQHRQAAPRHGRQDGVQVALDHVLARFERVDFAAEGQPGDDVDRVALQVAIEADGLALRGSMPPAPLQALRHRHQRGEICLDGARRHAGHHHAALVAPLATLCQEQTGDAAHFHGNRVARQRTPEAVRAVAQHGRHRFAVGHHQHQGAAEPGAHERAIAAHPAFHVAVDARQPHLQRVADDGQGKRPRQLADLAQGRGGGGCGGVVEWRHGKLLLSWNDGMTVARWRARVLNEYDIAQHQKMPVQSSPCLPPLRP